MIITVDCGSTNMRCRLFDNNTLLDEVKAMCGTRNVAFAGCVDPLVDALRDLIQQLLQRNNLRAEDVEAVVSAGTLASNAGLYHVPHALAPVGIAESAAAAKMTTLPHITSIPFLFIPGVCVAPTEDDPDPLHRIELYDSMSGEECETYGIAARLGLHGGYFMMMPGSYCQTFEVDPEGRIISVFTCMCGEFIAAISGHTFLKRTLPSPVIRAVDPVRLIEGFEYCARNGVSNSMVKSRMLHVWGNYTLDEAANFLVGAMMHDNIQTTVSRCAQSGKPIVLGGSNPLREVFRLLLAHTGMENVITVDDSIARTASSEGALLVYQQWKRLHHASQK